MDALIRVLSYCKERDGLAEFPMWVLQYNQGGLILLRKLMWTFAINLLELCEQFAGFDSGNETMRKAIQHILENDSLTNNWNYAISQLGIEQNDTSEQLQKEVIVKSTHALVCADAHRIIKVFLREPVYQMSSNISKIFLSP